MKHSPPLLLAAAMLVFACSDVAAPARTEARTPQVPEHIVVPVQLASSSEPQSPTHLPGGGSVAREEAEDASATVTGYTTVDFGGAGAEGYAEMTYFGTTASQTMTIAVSKDGSTIGSQAFTGGESWIFPVVNTVGLSGVVAAPSCGGVANASTTHSASMVWKTFSNGVSTSSSATPRTQSVCSTRTGTSGGGGTTGSGGVILRICTTTYYYSASGEFLYSEVQCRDELWMT